MTQLYPNVTRRQWESMCDKSASLLMRAGHYKYIRDHKRAAEIWAELSPLNRHIRAIGHLPHLDEVK